MNLKVVISKRNMVVRLINTDITTNEASNRVLDAWKAPGTDLRTTGWGNDRMTDLNPHPLNRVNVHYTNENKKTITRSYYCISEIINYEPMTFTDFDDMLIQ